MIIGQMVADQFKSSFQLSRSHYVFLLKIEDENEHKLLNASAMDFLHQNTLTKIGRRSKRYARYKKAKIRCSDRNT